MSGFFYFIVIQKFNIVLCFETQNKNYFNKTCILVDRLINF